jgi:hypothetical protein
MNNLVPEASLHPIVKQMFADFQKLQFKMPDTLEKRRSWGYLHAAGGEALDRY